MTTAKPVKKIVAYLRLSKSKKGMSKLQTAAEGYGILAQREDVESLAARHGAKIIAEITEVETGTNKRSRPELAKAIQQARLMGATLVIAKLDRLARNVNFVTTLLETKVDFVCCDMPEASILTIQVMAMVAEQEARAISERTRAGLRKAKTEKGRLLGSARPGHWDGREDRRGFRQAFDASLKVRRQRADDLAQFLVPTIKTMRSEGKSLRNIASELNARDHVTTRGLPFTDCSIRRMLARSEATVAV